VVEKCSWVVAEVGRQAGRHRMMGSHLAHKLCRSRNAPLLRTGSNLMHVAQEAVKRDQHYLLTF
jgi:hypothetical protein